MTAENKDKILSRIKKMLALANDRAATEGERDNAMRMVHEILASHNLSMSEAEAVGEVSEEKRIKSGLQAEKGEGQLNSPWIRQIASAIADLYFCKYFYMSYMKQGVVHYFVGKESNVVTAQEITKYVVSSIRKEARSLAKEHDKDSVFKLNFMKGATESIKKRCREIRAQAEVKNQAATNTCTALVLSSVYQKEGEANNKFLEEQGVKLRMAKTNQRSSHSDGYSSGREYGNRINLNHQIGGKGNNTPKLN